MGIFELIGLSIVIEGVRKLSTNYRYWKSDLSPTSILLSAHVEGHTGGKRYHRPTGRLMIESFEGKQGFSDTHILLIIFAFIYLIIFQHKEIYSGFFVTLCNFGHISETCPIQKSGSAAPFSCFCMF